MIVCYDCSIDKIDKNRKELCNMKKVLCALLACLLLALPLLALPVSAGSAAEGMLSDLLPAGEDDLWLVSAYDCDVRLNNDGSMTFKVTGTYPSLWLDMALDDRIFLGDAIDANQPAYFALDFQTAGSIVLRNMIFHYTRKDKAAMDTVADLWLDSMYGSDYASYRVQSDGMPYDPAAAIPNGTVRYVVWDWGGYLRDGSNKLFDDGMHHFTYMEMDLTGSAIGSELTFYTMGVVSDPNVELGQHTPEPVEPGTEFSYEIVDGGAVVTEYNGYETEVVVPEELGGYPVTAIGFGAFNSFRLERVQLPETVKVIEDYAFSWCFALREINFPEGLTSIGLGAFESCALESIHLPASVTEIGDYAFSDCSDTLRSITVADGNPAFEAKGNCLIDKETKTLLLGCASSVIPEGVSAIGKNAFIGCSGLKRIALPNGVKWIGECAFADCEALTTATLPNGLLRIESGAFQRCSSLQSIVIPDSVTSILSTAFAQCTELAAVTMSKNLTELGEYAFYYCTRLSSIVIPDGVTMLGDYTFWDCYGLTEIKLSKNLKSIGFSTFANNVSLRSIDLPKGLESIGAEAFIAGNLMNIVIPEGVKFIGDYAFYNNELTEAYIPASVEDMGEHVFGWCMSLTDVYCAAEKKPAGWSAKWLGDYQNAAVHWGYKEAAPLPGDLDGDGVIDSTDYMMVKRYVLGNFKLPEELQKLADIDGNGEVDLYDYMMIKRIAMGTLKIG